MNADQFLSNIRNAHDWLPGWAGRIGTRQKNSPSVPDDLVVERSGVCFVDGRDELDYLWYQLSEREGGFEYAGYRVVRLLQLSFLPLEARGDPGLLQKMRTVLRGLYGSQVNFLYLAAGIFNHQQAPVGIVQCYGVSAFANTLEEARALSLRSLAALKAAMSGAYRQVRLEPLTVRIAEWIFLSFHDMKHVLVTVGHTDPRENARGGNSALLRNPLVEAGPTAQQYTLQQNEILFRGMSDLREEFLFLVLTSPIGLSDITEMLTGLAEETSTWAAWQSGVRSVSFGVSLPAFLSGLMAQSASQGYSTSQGEAHSQGQAHTDSQAHTDGLAHTEGSGRNQRLVAFCNRFRIQIGGIGCFTRPGAFRWACRHGRNMRLPKAVGTSARMVRLPAMWTASNWGLRGGIQPAGVGIGGNVGWGSADGVSSMVFRSQYARSFGNEQPRGDEQPVGHRQPGNCGQRGADEHPCRIVRRFR